MKEGKVYPDEYLRVSSTAGEDRTAAVWIIWTHLQCKISDSWLRAQLSFSLFSLAPQIMVLDLSSSLYLPCKTTISTHKGVFLQLFHFKEVSFIKSLIFIILFCKIIHNYYYFGVYICLCEWMSHVFWYLRIPEDGIDPLKLGNRYL